MLDLLEPSEDEILELLVPVFVDNDVAPPEEGFLSLWTALDQQFGTEVQHVAPVVPLHHRFVRVVTTVAAAVVVLAAGLGLYGWQTASTPSQTPTKLDFAAAALRSDLHSGNSPARIEQDVTNLAQAMANSPATGGVTATPTQLLTSACQWLEGSTVPISSLPPACQTDGMSGRPDSSTPTQGDDASRDRGEAGGLAPNRGSLDPTRQLSDAPGTPTDPTGPEGGAPSGDAPSNNTAVPSAGSPTYADGGGTSAPTAPQTQSGSPYGEPMPSAGSPSEYTAPQGSGTFAPTNGSNTSPYSSSPLAGPSGCSVYGCAGGSVFTQGSSGSPRFQR